MQLCCRATALRASFLQQQPSVAVHAATAARDGFLGPTTTASPRGRELHTGAPAAAGISMFSGRSAGAPGRPAHTTTRALVAAALLLSSSSTAAAEGATRFGGWGGRRKGAHSTPSMVASAVASDATAGGTSAVEEGALPAAKLPVVFVLGGPGSGKGTQCERLAKEYG